MHVEAARRPYTLCFEARDPEDSYASVYPLASGELDRLLAEYPVVAYAPNRIELQNDQPSLRTFVVPATLGGGDAFTRTED